MTHTNLTSLSLFQQFIVQLSLRALLLVPEHRLQILSATPNVFLGRVQHDFSRIKDK